MWSERKALCLKRGPFKPYHIKEKKLKIHENKKRKHNKSTLKIQMGFNGWKQTKIEKHWFKRKSTSNISYFLHWRQKRHLPECETSIWLNSLPSGFPCCYHYLCFSTILKWKISRKRRFEDKDKNLLTINMTHRSIYNLHS